MELKIHKRQGIPAIRDKDWSKLYGAINDLQAVDEHLDIELSEDISDIVIRTAITNGRKTEKIPSVHTRLVRSKTGSPNILQIWKKS